MLDWWNSFDDFEKFYWYFAMPFSLTFIINLILTVIGLGDELGDVDGDGIPDIDDSEFLDGDFKLLTIRNIFIFFMIFGWGGLAFYNLGYSKFVSSILAFGCGMLAVIVEAGVFYLFSKLSASGNMNLHNAVGKTGSVYIPIPANKSGVGKIQITFQGVFREVEAMTEGDRISTGSVVKVNKVYNNTLLVEKEE